MAATSLVLTSLALSGCIVPVDFDPVGTAASVQGAWTVNGASPTEESCGEVRYVRVRFFDLEDEEHRDHAGLVFDCASGGFDTRPERLVAAGVWHLAPIAIRADGSEVTRGAVVEVDTNVEGGHHIALAPFDIEVTP